MPPEVDGGRTLILGCVAHDLSERWHQMFYSTANAFPSLGCIDGR
jgi:hypothetical protein